MRHEIIGEIGHQIGMRSTQEIPEISKKNRLEIRLDIRIQHEDSRNCRRLQMRDEAVDHETNA